MVFEITSITKVVISGEVQFLYSENLLVYILTICNLWFFFFPSPFVVVFPKAENIVFLLGVQKEFFSGFFYSQPLGDSNSRHQERDFFQKYES